MIRKHDRVLMDMIEQSARNTKAHPLNLGGVGGGAGGVGSPPGGYIGWIPQGRVAYDEDELATLATNPSGFNPPSGWSLIDNLNHIRYRIGQLEVGSGVLVVDDSITTVNPTSHITFSGGVVVTDLGGGNALVNITASGGGGTPTDTPNRVAVFDDAGNLSTNSELNYDYINKVLLIGEDNPLGPTYGGIFHSTASGVSAGMFHYAIGMSPTIAGYETFMRAMGDYDNPQAVTDGAVIGRLRGRPHDGVGWENTQVEIRYLVVGDHDASNHGTAIEFYTTPSGSTTLTKAMTLKDDGTVNIEAGTTYDIDGVPHTHNSILVVEELDGSPSVSDVSKIIFSGAVVTDMGGGDVLVTISGTGGSSGGVGGAFQRNLTADLTLADGECLVIVDYLNQGAFIVTLNGDSVIAIVDGI